MFTGIIETLGTIKRITTNGSNRNFLVESDIGKVLKIDQSVCHNGVCLTVTKVDGGSHWTTAVQETLEKSNLGNLSEGDIVNLERSMLNNGRFDGHLVQGHVDVTGTVASVRDENGSWVFEFKYVPAPGLITVEKGSICVNGISLTCYNCTENSFGISVIPYTYQNTNLSRLRSGDRVNLEFDIIGKYVQKVLAER